MNRRIALCTFSLIVLLCNLLYFCMFGGIGHPIIASGVSIQEFSLSSGHDPWGTTIDPNGHIWLAIPSCDPTPTCNSNLPPGEIAEFNPSTSNWMYTSQLPAGYAQPIFLAFDAQGQLWFTMPMGNSIGMFSPATNTFQQWPVPTANAGPWDLAIDHNSKIWFTERYTNKIGCFDPVTQTFTEVSTPAPNSNPYGIVDDASNNVWFTENNSSVALIGEYTSGGQLNEYKIRTSLPGNLTPHMITLDPNGNIWWTEG